MIQELNDLVHFTKTSIWRDEELLQFFARNDTGILHLYRTIWDRRLNSDDAAAKAAGLGLTTYKKLGRQLRRHLRDMAVFFNDEKAKADTAAKNYVEGVLETALMQLLHTRGYRHAAMTIAKRLLRRGCDYDVPAFAADALRVLKETSWTTGGNGQEFERYTEQYWKFREYADAEERAAECFQWLRLPQLRTKSVRQALPQRLRGRLDALKPYAGETPSSLFHLYYFIVFGDYHLEICDYAGALRCYDEAIAWFGAKHYSARYPLAVFHCAKIIPCIILGQYEQGEAAALAGLDSAPEDSAIFFSTYEHYFYLAMHAGRYDQALDVFQTATWHKRFGNLRAPQREIWHVLGAYLFIAATLTGWPLPPNSLPAYKSVRFSNEISHAGSDKQGMNVCALIAHVLLLLLESREDTLPERLQALDKYRERHLHDADTDRSEVFIKILTLLPKAQFRQTVFLQKAEPYLKNLEELPRRLSSHRQELEVIPYPVLVQQIAKFLGRRTTYSPKKHL